MTASRASAPVAAAALLTLLATGCRTPAGAPPPSAFHEPARSATAPPDLADRTAADLARAVLVSDREETTRLLGRMQALDVVLDTHEERPTGLLPVAIDLRNTTLDDSYAYRQATGELLSRNDLDPSLRARLELFRDDAPLELAADRMRDAWLLDFGRAFNALAEPVGRSILSAQLAPYRLGRSLVNYAVEVYTREALSLQRRQALAHWKDFLARHPGAPEAERIAPRVKSAQARYLRLQRDRAADVAEHSLDLGKVRLALVYADRALRFAPEDGRASALRDEAARQLLEIRDAQRASLDASDADPVGPDPRETRSVAVALLLPDGDAAGSARRLREAQPDGPLADEARFVEAVALGESGQPEAMWAALEALAAEDPKRSNMARHAEALVNSPEQNTYQAFVDARSADRWGRARWVLLGPFFRGMPDRGLPGPLEWIVDAPSLAESVAGTPMRLINVPWAEALPSARVAAAYARQHLRREPEGPRSEAVRNWLEGYERRRGNWIAALDVAESRPDPDVAELAEMRERAAGQYLRAATYERTRSLRLGMYRQLGIIYPGSRAARVAGELARAEVTGATPQEIRVSREFLLENPEVAGPGGLALRPELLDGDAANAEIHPEGVTLIGARAVRVSYLGASGDEEAAPLHRYETLREEHLARVVSQLEETSYRNMLLDPLEEVGTDANRDLYFERVRLGLADEIDERPDASSHYAYRGLSERYGMVRYREPILPFDVVVQGSLHTFSLGAFPRIRPPRETADAMLYR